jgi:hypothetical protein
VARVGSYDVSAFEYEALLRQFESLYEKNAGHALEAADRPVFQRTVLEQLIRQRLLRAEAKRRGIAGTDQEAESFLRQTGPFRNAGGFDEDAWSAFKSNPAAYPRAMADAREVIGSQKLFERMRTQLTPSDDRLAALVAERTAGAEVRVLAIEDSWLQPGIDLSSDWLRAH